MSRRPAAITQADVARALRAATSSGNGWRVEIRPDGIISLLPIAASEVLSSETELVGSADDGASIIL